MMFSLAKLSTSGGANRLKEGGEWGWTYRWEKVQSPHKGPVFQKAGKTLFSEPSLLFKHIVILSSTISDSLEYIQE